MKRRLTLSIALVLSIVFAAMISTDSTVTAQNHVKIVADTGFIPIHEGQVLRITVLGALDLNDLYFRVNRQNYTQGVCSGGGVCKHAAQSQTISDPIRLMSGEAASFDITPMQNSSGVRGVVLSSRRDIRVNASIVDAVTGEVQVLVALLLP